MRQKRIVRPGRTAKSISMPREVGLPTFHPGFLSHVYAAVHWSRKLGIISETLGFNFQLRLVLRIWCIFQITFLNMNLNTKWESRNCTQRTMLPLEWIFYITKKWMVTFTTKMRWKSESSFVTKKSLARYVISTSTLSSVAHDDFTFYCGK